MAPLLLFHLVLPLELFDLVQKVLLFFLEIADLVLKFVQFLAQFFPNFRYVTSCVGSLCQLVEVLSHVDPFELLLHFGLGLVPFAFYTAACTIR